MTKLQLNNKDYKDTPDRHLIEALGILPIWVKEWATGWNHYGNDLLRYMSDVYGFGTLYKFGGEVLDDGTYRSQDDPDMPWMGKMDTPNGTAYFYEYSILALPMVDGSHYVTRMD
tara:strand:+ start:118 stop:462 length:345 start_codon:yes stop_codon:yes gene_type:complete